MAGGGIKGGTVVGSSDKDGAMPEDRPVQVSDLHASILHAMGIDPQSIVYNHLNQPRELVKAEMVETLFA